MLAVLNANVGYFNTFSGLPVAVAVGTAVLDVIAKEDLMINATRPGEYFKQQLQDIQARFEEVSDVRGAGLFLGLAPYDPMHDGATDIQRNTVLINDLKRNGVLIGGGGKTGRTF